MNCINAIMKELFPDSKLTELGTYEAQAAVGTFVWRPNGDTADFILPDPGESIPANHWQPTLNTRALLHYALVKALPSFKRLSHLKFPGDDGITISQHWYVAAVANGWLAWCGEAAGDGYMEPEGTYWTGISYYRDFVELCDEAFLSREDVEPWAKAYLPKPEPKEEQEWEPDEIPF